MRLVWHGVGAFLPGDDEGVLLTRAWLSWCELWRSEEWLTRDVGELRAKERGMVAEAHEFRPMRPSQAGTLLGRASAAALERAS